LRSKVINRYRGVTGRAATIDEAPLSMRLENYLFSLGAYGYMLEAGQEIWITGKDDRRIAMLKTLIKLEKAFNEMIEYLRMLNADSKDVSLVEECRDKIVFTALEDREWVNKRNGKPRGPWQEDVDDEDEESKPEGIDMVIAECYKKIKDVECKYLTRSKRRCEREDEDQEDLEEHGEARRRRRKRGSSQQDSS